MVDQTPSTPTPAPVAEPGAKDHVAAARSSFGNSLVDCVEHILRALEKLVANA